ncbi:MAG: cation-translocating P-type ATPase [Anaerolineae bacterium]|nr:cation-translocating P-type ATPase [Anaerolineae bacterium]
MIHLPISPTEWHRLTVAAALQQLAVDPESGLSPEEVKQRQAQFGPNELEEKGGKPAWRILWEQISSTMVLILIAAAIISGFLGKVTETAAIAAIVVLFALLGFFQEYRAEQAMAALKKLATPIVRARRGGQVVEVSARDLVPGDIILLEAGSAVPADIRLIEAVNLRLQEAALTGESEPVDKQIEPIARDNTPLGDRRNMGYMGTAATYGRGVAVVVETGMKTELGKIATLIQDVSEGMTPLQKNLDRVGKQLAIGGIAVAAFIFVLGLGRGESISDMFLIAVSVAVAVVPEGLPAVVTVTLALGAQRMLRRRALIRKLPAVETLGSVTVICSDKTGTLTVNRMTVTVVDVAGHYLELQGTGHHPVPALRTAESDPDLFRNQPQAINLTLAGGAMCNDASLQPDRETGRYQAVGDPTEGALLVAAAQAGLPKSELRQAAPRVAEWPFDSDRKRMSTVHQLPADAAQLPVTLQALHTNAPPYIAITKGSTDGLLALCTRVWVVDGPVPLDEEWRGRIQAANDQMAQNGMRVLGVAVQPLAAIPTNIEAELEQNLTFVGMVGMIDPPRPEVKNAVQTAKTAGIRPIMITGDHPLTARFIAYDLGITENGRVKTGQDLSRMTAEELDAAVRDVSVFARVSPEHKLRIVEALQRQGEIAAMTGDGVNDSPALKKADIGIAMGITGTDVSKEASKMVLLDDNFATIVAAIEEGRVIYDNIRRFVKFSIAGNIGKVLVMLVAPFLGMTVALLPLQLLWLNLMTDGLLGLGLGVEAAEPGTMKKRPRDPKASLFSEGMGFHVLWVGILIGLVALGLGYSYYDPANPADTTWQTMMFSVLAFLQIGQALASRSTQASLFQLGLRSNPVILGLAGLVLALQLLVIYLPGLDTFFGITPLSLPDLLLALGLGLVTLVAIETEKWFLRRRG